jgi:hypothetical protein
MVLISYVLGRRFYPVPYDVPRVIGYVALGLGLYAGHGILVEQLGWSGWISATLVLVSFVGLVSSLDGRRLMRAAV